MPFVRGIISDPPPVASRPDLQLSDLPRFGSEEALARYITLMQNNRTIAQVGELSNFATRIMADLAEHSDQIIKRVEALQGRMQMIKEVLPALDQKVQSSMVLNQLDPDRSDYRTWADVDCNLFTKETSDPSIRDVYETLCYAPPNLSVFDHLRTDGQASMKFYSYPQFFVDEWKAMIVRETNEKKRKRKELKSALGRTGNVKVVQDLEVKRAANVDPQTGLPLVIEEEEPRAPPPRVRRASMIDVLPPGERTRRVSVIAPSEAAQQAPSNMSRRPSVQSNGSQQSSGGITGTRRLSRQVTEEEMFAVQQAMAPAASVTRRQSIQQKPYSRQGTEMAISEEPSYGIPQAPPPAPMSGAPLSPDAIELLNQISGMPMDRRQSIAQTQDHPRRTSGASSIGSHKNEFLKSFKKTVESGIRGLKLQLDKHGPSSPGGSEPTSPRANNIPLPPPPPPLIMAPMPGIPNIGGGGGGASSATESQRGKSSGAPVPIERVNLLNDIRKGGFALRKVASEDDMPKPKLPGKAVNEVAAILMRRAAFEHSDSEDEQEGGDDNWD